MIRLGSLVGTDGVAVDESYMQKVLGNSCKITWGFWGEKIR